MVFINIQLYNKRFTVYWTLKRCHDKNSDQSTLVHWSEFFGPDILWSGPLIEISLRNLWTGSENIWTEKFGPMHRCGLVRIFYSIRVTKIDFRVGLKMNCLYPRNSNTFKYWSRDDIIMWQVLTLSISWNEALNFVWRKERKPLFLDDKMKAG